YRVPATTVTTLTFNARVGMVVPAGAPNPLGTDFGRLAGTVVLISSEVDGFDMYGAVSLEFEPASLAQYGLDVGAAAFVQINTTDDDQTVELIYFGSTDPVPVELGANSFKLFIQGDVAIFPPGGSPANALFTMNG